MSNEKELKKLEKRNISIRDGISDIIEEWGGDKNELWSLINELVENELEQEGLCNENN